MVNGSNTLIKKLNVTANGRPVYDCDYANHCVNIKNLFEYNPSYAKSVGTNEFYFLDTSRSAEEIKYNKRNANDTGGTARSLVENDNPDYNKGFAARKALLVLSTAVNCEIPLNRYSFFEELQDKLLRKVVIKVCFPDQNPPYSPIQNPCHISVIFCTCHYLCLFQSFFIFQKNFLMTKIITETFGKMTCIFLSTKLPSISVISKKLENFLLFSVYLRLKYSTMTE